MKSQREILKAHYSHLVRTFASKASVVAVVIMSLILPSSSLAYGQITARSTTVSSSLAAATTVTYTTKFTFAGSGQTVGALFLELCDSPLPNGGTCNNTAGSAGAAGSSGASFTSATSATVAVNSGTWTNAGTCAMGTHVGNNMIITCTVGAITATPTVTVTVNNVTNPTNPNRNYALHVSSYTNTAASTPAYPGTDFGAMALSTTSSMLVQANVQESLSFCAGTTPGGSSNCSTISGTTVNIGSGTDNVLSNANGTGAVSLLYLSTNAANSGYTVSYTTTSTTGGNFASGANVFGNAASQTLAACTSASTVSCFGINLAVNTVTSTPAGAIGTVPAGGAATTVTAGYATADSFKFVPGTTSQNILTETSAGPTTQTTATISYVAQAGPTTPPGAYATTFNYVAVGTF